MTEGLKRRHLLLAEDDDSLRQAMTHYFSSEFDVFAVATPKEAIQYIEIAPKIGLLVTDFDFGGGLDGMDIAVAMRARCPDTPIIVMTGSYAETPGIREILSMPNTSFIGKPFNLDHVAQTIVALSENQMGGEN